MRRIAVALLFVGLALPAEVGAQQQDRPRRVTVGDNYFDSADLRVRVGKRIRWIREGSGPEHNVSEDHGIFRSGPPRGGAFEFSVRVSAGTFPYFCEVHGGVDGEGMAGVIRVPVRLAPFPPDETFTVRWATKGSVTGQRFDVQWRSRAKWQRWQRGVTAKRAVFGRDGDPVVVTPGEAYQFRARTRTAAGSTGDWSPVVTFRA